MLATPTGAPIAVAMRLGRIDPHHRLRRVNARSLVLTTSPAIGHLRGADRPLDLVLLDAEKSGEVPAAVLNAPAADLKGPHFVAGGPPLVLAKGSVFRARHPVAVDLRLAQLRGV